MLEKFVLKRFIKIQKGKKNDKSKKLDAHTERA